MCYSWSFIRCGVLFMEFDLYKVLGVPKRATTKQIKTAYRQRARQCHPDKTKLLPVTEQESAAEEFKKINLAHEVLTDLNGRTHYDRNGSISVCADNPEQRPTNQSISNSFRIRYNNRVELSGFSKSEFVVHNEDYRSNAIKFTLELAKHSLDPMLDRFNELVDALNNKAFKFDDNNKPVVINEKYEKVANKMNAMHNEIMATMSVLHGDLIHHDDMLRALRASQTTIIAAQTDGEFAIHRGFVRNCPILRELCVCLDLIVNFFDFLVKKLSKIFSADKTPVFSNMQEFKCGMFKPIPTNTARRVDELNTDMTWYIKNIENQYECAKPDGYK